MIGGSTLNEDGFLGCVKSNSFFGSAAWQSGQAASLRDAVRGGPRPSCGRFFFGDENSFAGDVAGDEDRLVGDEKRRVGDELVNSKRIVHECNMARCPLMFGQLFLSNKIALQKRLTCKDI